MSLEYFESRERQSPRAALLELVEMGCRRLLASGGGPLEREVPHAGKPVPEAEQAVWLQLAQDGATAYRIAKDRGWAKATVRRYLRRFRAEGRLSLSDKKRLATIAA